MKKKKLLIIGKNSFLGKNLYTALKNKTHIRILSIEDFRTLDKKIIKKYSHICNFSINPKYIKFKYKKQNDIDLEILKKIQKSNINYIFISTRKIYLNKKNIKESETAKPQCNYSKNKLITENRIIELFPKNFTILRVSNVLGLKDESYRKTHVSFIDNYIKYLFSNKKIYYVDDYKDFITIKQFIKFFYLIFKKNIKGIYNVSLGKKIYVSTLLNWLNYKNMNKKFLVKKNVTLNDSFTLNNSKLLSILKIKIKKSEVKKFCELIGKNIYFKKIIPNNF
jgi:dTDP-4-dehydrorhamnose reductase